MRKYRALQDPSSSYIQISPSYVVDGKASDAVNPLPLKTRIDIYRDLVSGWLLSPARTLLRTPDGEFAAIALLLCYFEGHEIWRTGTDSRGRSRSFFISAFKNVFPDSVIDPGHALPAGFDLRDAMANKLYEWARCGFFHTGMVRPGVGIVRLRGRVALRSALDSTGRILSVLIYPPRFLKDIELHFERYIGDLRNPRNKVLRQNFEKAWKLTGYGQALHLPPNLRGNA